MIALSLKAKPYSQPKLKRLLVGNRMTIAATALCNGGIVLGADTDEIVGDMKRRVAKIPMLIPHAQNNLTTAAITGACENGHLMDSAVERIFEQLPSCNDATEVDTTVRSVMLSLYRNEFKVYPHKQKGMRLLVVVRARKDKKAHAWSVDCSDVHRIKRGYKIVGYGELVEFVLGHLYGGGLTLDARVVAMIQLLATAKQRVNYVGGDSYITVVLDDGGIAGENVSFYPEQEELLPYFLTHGRDLLLATANRRFTEEQYQELLTRFSENMKCLREKLCSSNSAKWRQNLMRSASQKSEQEK
ncbi:MAG: hypothetical protein L0Z53_11255 [Acidobacteriales bacterium]|nr:hypothetical protein [Terriglobales bacterium]